MYLTVIPKWIQMLLPSFVWKSEEIYLITFDDGPHPDSTPSILRVLKEKNLQVQFFCLAENMERYPDLVKEILYHGHQIGIHGYSHHDAWHLSFDAFKNDFDKAVAVAEKLDISIKKYRPPYGHILPKQWRYVHSLEFEIVMWTVMPGDFDITRPTEKVVSNFQRNLENNNIIVLHDSPSTLSNVLHCLESVI